MKWLLMRWSNQMLLLLIRSHMLLLTQRLRLIRPSPLCTLMDDSMEDPLTGRCLLGMLTMWRIDYGREKYFFRCFYQTAGDPSYLYNFPFTLDHTKIVGANSAIQNYRKNPNRLKFQTNNISGNFT